jgi:hypothetical protein
MLITDFWMLDGFIERHPPVDVLIAAHLGYKSAAQRKKPSAREAARMNSEALAAMPPRRNVRSILQMPAAARTPEMLQVIANMREQWKNSA